MKYLPVGEQEDPVLTAFHFINQDFTSLCLLRPRDKLSCTPMCASSSVSILIYQLCCTKNVSSCSRCNSNCMLSVSPKRSMDQLPSNDVTTSTLPKRVQDLVSYFCSLYWQHKLLLRHVAQHARAPDLIT